LSNWTAPLAREFVALRDDLVELAPEAGEDADADHPGRREPFDAAEAERWQEWSFTLANFDAIATSPATKRSGSSAPRSPASGSSPLS